MHRLSTLIVNIGTQDKSGVLINVNG